MLEAIKRKKQSLEELVDNGSVNVSLLNDFNWLIGQAEKLEALVNGSTEITNGKIEELRGVLREIEVITRGLGEFNPTYEKIHKLAIKGVD